MNNNTILLGAVNLCVLSFGDSPSNMVAFSIITGIMLKGYRLYNQITPSDKLAILELDTFRKTWLTAYCFCKLVHKSLIERELRYIALGFGILLGLLLISCVIPAHMQILLLVDICCLVETFYNKNSIYDRLKKNKLSLKRTYSLLVDEEMASPTKLKTKKSSKRSTNQGEPASAMLSSRLKRIQREDEEDEEDNQIKEEKEEEMQYIEPQVINDPNHLHL